MTILPKKISDALARFRGTETEQHYSPRSPMSLWPPLRENPPMPYDPRLRSADIVQIETAQVSMTQVMESSSISFPDNFAAQTSAPQESTMATAVVTPAKSGFGFASIGHALASGFTYLHKACLFVENNVIPTLQKSEGAVEDVTALVAPQAVAIERAAFQSLGLISAVVKELDSADEAVVAAASKKLSDLGLDNAAIASYKALLSDSEAALAKLGVSL